MRFAPGGLIGYVQHGYYGWMRNAPGDEWRKAAWHWHERQAAFHARKIAGPDAEVVVAPVGTEPSRHRIARTRRPGTIHATP